MEIIKSAVKGGENMNVLIIGGMGVIGGAITKAAIKKGIDVSVVSRRAIFGEWLELGINGIQGDWKDDVFAEKVVKKGYDVIVDTQVFNVDQLKRSLNIANNHCKQYIYISTDSVYEHPAENLSEDVTDAWHCSRCVSDFCSGCIIVCPVSEERKNESDGERILFGSGNFKYL